MVEACVEGRCTFLDGRVGYLEQGFEASSKVESKVRELQQHLDVLQAQTDLLQRQLQKEASRSAGLAVALRQSNANCIELWKRQHSSTETIQSGLRQIMGKLVESGPEAGCFNTVDIGSTMASVASTTRVGGEECIEALERLRAQLTTVAADIAAELDAGGMVPKPDLDEGGFE